MNDNKEHFDLVWKMTLLPLAKYLHEQKPDVDKITKNDLGELLRTFLNNKKYSPQIMFHPYASHMETIKIAAKNGDFLSAAVLTAITLEEELNGFVREGCFAKGYSHNQITNFVTEMGFKTKIDLVLPLLGFTVSDKYRNIVFEFFPLRNQIAHGKSLPSLHYRELSNESDNLQEVDELSSYEINMEKAKKLVEKYPIEKILKLSDEMDEAILHNIPELNNARKLLLRHNFFINT